jgi:L-seryl-tRNA(Ser) seleniumtransferase
LARAIAREAARAAIDARRAAIRSAAAEAGDGAERLASMESVLAECRRRLERLRAPNVTPAINATGIIIHTGMGRSPLAAEAIAAIGDVARGYCDVAIGKADGGRRKRSGAVEGLLRALTGCEAAVVVNNNAAGVMLALATHARGREVVVSRGQLVEIGGSFRLPDVMESAGVALREVGTTNKTRLADYERAIGDRTAALMRMHPSNYRIVGFTESVGIEDLARLGREWDSIVIDDIGSGALIDFAPYGLKGEPTARASVEAGADLVLFSGDKLLGGPQAGIIVGREAAVRACERHPMMRALRPDKLTLAALEATLRLYLDPARLVERLPVLRAIAESAEAVRARAGRLQAMLEAGEPKVRAEIVDDFAYVGGGSLPDERLPSSALVLIDPKGGPEEAKRRLRLGKPSVFARVRKERLEFDLRTVGEGELEALASAIRAAVR